MNFEDFSLGSDILQAIGEIGFEIPTPIQEQLIPILMEDNEDVIGLAQTGTGKTAAFGLPLLLRINPEIKSPQALVVCPTRELCVQVAKDITSFSKYLRSISVTAVYGGAPMDAQIRSIKKGTKIIVATPGRLLDLMKRNVINLNAVNFLALDEADTMLSMGFKDEMDAILEQVPPERRTVLLSATMPREVARIASQFMNNPVEIAAGPKNIGASTVEHGYYMVHARDKYAALKRIVDYHPDMYAIVFCRTRAATQEVADKLLQDEYDAEPLHGDLSQAQRDFVMKKFRDRNLQLLIATDIAARGLDVTDLTHVIHYDLPDDQDTYTHRSGRTGRAGKKGISLAIINMKQKYRIRHLEKVAGARFAEMRVPRGEEICERQLMHLVDRVKGVDIDEDRIASYMPIIEQKLDGLDRDTLIRHFVSLEFNRFIDYYRNLPDLTPPQNQPRQDRDRGERGSRGSSSGDFTVLKLNIGKKEGIFPADVINLVNRFSGKRITLGKIDIGSSDTRMQVESFAARTLAESLSGTTIKGRKLRVMVQQSSERTTKHSSSRPRKGPNQGRSGNYSGKRPEKKRTKKSFYGG